MPSKLGQWEGKTVTKATVAVRNAGDGLSQAMHVDPQPLKQGSTVYVVMECEVGPVSFDPIKDSSSECVRKHVLRAGAATIVDAALVKQAVEAQTEKIIEAREKERGIQQLPTNEKLLKDHDQGEHDAPPIGVGPYIGCPECFPDTVDTPPAKPAAARHTKTSKPRGTKAPAKKSTGAPRKSTAKK